MLSLYYLWVVTGDAIYQPTCAVAADWRGQRLFGPTGAVTNRVRSASATRADSSALCGGSNCFGHSWGCAYESTQSGALRFEGFGTGCWGSFARSAGTRPTAFDYRRRQDLGGRLGMSETQRFGLCAGVVDDASASEAHSKTLPGGQASPIAKAWARDGFQNLVGACGEAAQDSVLLGAARSGV